MQTVVYEKIFLCACVYVCMFVFKGLYIEYYM